MSKYTVKVETLGKHTYEVEADSAAEAIAKAEAVGLVAFAIAEEITLDWPTATAEVQHG